MANMLVLPGSSSLPMITTLPTPEPDPKERLPTPLPSSDTRPAYAGRGSDVVSPPTSAVVVAPVTEQANKADDVLKAWDALLAGQQSDGGVGAYVDSGAQKVLQGRALLEEVLLNKLGAELAQAKANERNVVGAQEAPVATNALAKWQEILKSNAPIERASRIQRAVQYMPVFDSATGRPDFAGAWDRGDRFRQEDQMRIERAQERQTQNNMRLMGFHEKDVADKNLVRTFQNAQRMAMARLNYPDMEIPKLALQHGGENIRAQAQVLDNAAQRRTQLQIAAAQRAAASPVNRVKEIGQFFVDAAKKDPKNKDKYAKHLEALMNFAAHEKPDATHALKPEEVTAMRTQAANYFGDRAKAMGPKLDMLENALRGATNQAHANQIYNAFIQQYP